MAAVIETDRLLIRRWRDEDAAPFAAINAEPEVRRYLGIEGGREETEAAMARQRALQEAEGLCFWATERKADGALLGFCGLRPGVPDTPIAGGLEIGWRLGSAYWGQGYAREAASACLDWAFSTAGARQVAAITVAANTRSWTLMERLGMVRRPDLDFLHPMLPDGHPLRPHITYVEVRP
jgi:RimJ/RimL family protein N-acetyltransferase